MLATMMIALVILKCPCGHIYTPGKTLTEPQALRLAELHTTSRSAARGMVRIAKAESSLRPKAQNPKSTAYGLYQFLNGTWKGTGIKKTDCPKCQTKAAYIYIKNRYKTVDRAVAHKRKYGWY